jgi:non-ribosomal peptide synthetase component F
MALHAAVVVLLAQWSGSHDILIGTPTAKRNRRELEEMIGSFADTLLLRTRLAGDPTLADFLTALRDADIAAFAHQQVAYARIIAEVLPERAEVPSAVMQVMLTLNDMPAQHDALPGITVAPMLVYRGGANRELEFTCHETPEGGLFVELIYDRELFTGAAMTQLMARLDRLLTAMAADPMARLSALQAAD